MTKRAHIKDMPVGAVFYDDDLDAKFEKRNDAGAMYNQTDNQLEDWSDLYDDPEMVYDYEEPK